MVVTTSYKHQVTVTGVQEGSFWWEHADGGKEGLRLTASRDLTRYQDRDSGKKTGMQLQRLWQFLGTWFQGTQQEPSHF